MSSSSSSSSGGIGFCGLLTILFIALKMMDKIDWPWLWVLAPLWIPLAIFCFGVVVICVCCAGKAFLEWRKSCDDPEDL